MPVALSWAKIATPSSSAGLEGNHHQIIDIKKECASRKRRSPLRDRVLGNQNHDDGDERNPAWPDLDKAGLEAALVVGDMLTHVDAAPPYSPPAQSLQNADHNNTMGANQPAVA